MRRRSHGFRVRFRGFDRSEVVAALAKLGLENEDAQREIERLGAEIDRLQTSIAEQFENGRHVQHALIAASKLADEIQHRAEEDALQIRREAEADGKLIIQRLHDKARRLEEQIEGLLARRREVEASIGSFIKAIADELEQQRRQEAEEPKGSTLAEAG